MFGHTTRRFPHTTTREPWQDDGTITTIIIKNSNLHRVGLLLADEGVVMLVQVGEGLMLLLLEDEAAEDVRLRLILVVVAVSVDPIQKDGVPEDVVAAEIIMVVVEVVVVVQVVL